MLFRWTIALALFTVINSKPESEEQVKDLLKTVGKEISGYYKEFGNGSDIPVKLVVSVAQAFMLGNAYFRAVVGRVCAKRPMPIDSIENSYIDLTCQVYENIAAKFLAYVGENLGTKVKGISHPAITFDGGVDFGTVQFTFDSLKEIIPTLCERIQQEIFTPLFKNIDIAMVEKGCNIVKEMNEKEERDYPKEKRVDDFLAYLRNH